MEYTINREIALPPVKTITLELTLDEFYIIGKALYTSNAEETVAPHAKFCQIRTEAGLVSMWRR